MPEFSACYFCGTALDAPLAEYPVVPETLHPSADQQRTVVLCPSCRRKLGAVVDAVVGAVDDAPSDQSIQQDLEAAGNGAGDEGDDGSADEAPDDGGFEFEDASEESSAGEPADDEAGISAAPTDHDDGPALDESATTDDASVAVGVTGDDVTDGEPAGDDATDDDPTDGDVTDGDSTDGDATDDDAEDDADEARLTALEYNKVMRLLQNREFPVDRDEFKIVATNAYEIGDEEFDAIIDAAADRGLIGLDGGHIVES